jgi:hypothetical protein
MMNSNMKEIVEQKESYSSSFTAKVSAHEALERIERVSDWWTASFRGNSQSIGGVFTVQFGETFANFEVVELIQGKRAVWLVTDCNISWTRDKKEWKGTKLVWELSSEGDKTKVIMTHVGLVPRIECYDDCKSGWDFYFGKSLQRFLTEGKGLPDVHRGNR